MAEMFSKTYTSVTTRAASYGIDDRRIETLACSVALDISLEVRRVEDRKQQRAVRDNSKTVQVGGDATSEQPTTSMGMKLPVRVPELGVLFDEDWKVVKIFEENK